MKLQVLWIDWRWRSSVKSQSWGLKSSSSFSSIKKTLRTPLFPKSEPFSPLHSFSHCIETTVVHVEVINHSNAAITCTLSYNFLFVFACCEWSRAQSAYILYITKILWNKLYKYEQLNLNNYTWVLQRV